jgi:hypothetical protein
MTCADGSSTGVALSRGKANVVVFLNGGGACWGAGACDPARTPMRFGAAEFELARRLLLPDSILDRDLPTNPFAGWTMVFVPYCTGDVHAGDSETVHGGVLWRHQGWKNLEAALGFVAGAVPTPPRVVLAGSSAGGFGALLGYDLIRGHWPKEGGTEAALLDDSAPTFVGTTISEGLRSAWWTEWNLASTVTPRCPGCRDDLSAVWTILSATYPADRFALLSSTADSTMRIFFGGMTGTAYEENLDQLALQLEGLPNANARSFRVIGTAHPLLLRPAVHASADATLLEWLRPVASGTGDFASAGP